MGASEKNNINFTSSSESLLLTLAATVDLILFAWSFS